MTHSEFAKRLRVIARRANSSMDKELTTDSKAYIDTNSLISSFRYVTVEEDLSPGAIIPFPDKNGVMNYSFPERALEAIKDGRFIDSIKIYRKWSGLGLKEAKGMCDKIRDHLRSEGEIT